MEAISFTRALYVHGLYIAAHNGVCGSQWRSNGSG